MTWPKNAPASTWDGHTDSWMTQLDGSLLLRDLSIPGTHDTVSLYGHCLAISTTQYATLEQQLDAGIRFLDLRVKTDGEHGLKMVHGAEDIGESADKRGRLSFKTVLTSIYDWMEKHPQETVIIKVLDCDTDGLNSEPTSYDTDLRIRKIWGDLDKEKSKNRLDFNLGKDPKTYLNYTLGDVRGQLLLWRVFKADQVKVQITGGYGVASDGIDTVVEEFGLNLYGLRGFDNNADFDVLAPGTVDRVNKPDVPLIGVLNSQSLYEGDSAALSYARKMNAVLQVMYNTWCGHANNVWENPLHIYALNELNIATSAGQAKSIFSYYPITNATYINPLISNLLDNMLSDTTPHDWTPAHSRTRSGVGVLLFDWADDPTGATRDYEKTRALNEPIYKKVIRLNFEASQMWRRNDGDNGFHYLPTENSPFVELKNPG